ncbi:MAG: FG-GAP-like repeat-containing protein [Planctomycetota bacterium]|nr:FG-GAP-like repeat-containing protein [Planctomycetota bacterium]
MNHDKPSSNRSRLIPLVVGAVVIAAVVGTVMRMRTPPGHDPGTVPAPGSTSAMTAEQANDLIRKAQLANGHLENVELNEADVLYSEIVEQLPNEPLGVRNQAICRYLLFDLQKIEAADVQAALVKLEKLQPHDASTHWLLGKTAAKAGITESAAAAGHFEQAAELSPETAVYWYEAYDAARVMPAGDVQANQFLEKAYRLAPSNLFLLGDWLLAQALAKDPAIAETLEAAKTTFAPLRDTVLKRHATDIFQLLDDAGAALVRSDWAASETFANGDWAEVVRSARSCLNVTRPNDFTQGDKRALLPHPLEFVVNDFSDDFNTQFPRSKTSEPLIDMSYTKTPPTDVRGDIRDSLTVDFDLDKTLELVVLEADKLTVYRHSGSASWGEQLTSIALAGQYDGLLAADLDGDRDHRVNQPSDGSTTSQSTSCFDADADIVVYGQSGLLLLRNVRGEDGQRTLEIVEQEESLNDIKDVVTAILVDFDHDSNLDIVCSTAGGLAALLGQGDLTYADVSRFSTFPTLEAASPVSSLVAVDWDRDVDIDIIAVAADHSLGYLENLRHGNFRWQPFSKEYAQLRDATSLAVVESDANVSWDLIGGGSFGVSLLQTSTPYPGKVRLEVVNQISKAGANGLLVADVDNNGYQDSVVWTSEAVSVFRAKGDGSFAEPLVLVELPADVRRCDFGDVDNDGDLDLCVVGTSEVALFTNEGGNQNSWLSIRAMGQVDNKGKANHHGIGSLIEVKAGRLYQAQVVAKPVTHFGLGKESNATIVRFLWTNGVPQDQLEPAANQAICELMTLKGSCPYVYTWTGERFEFFTDCLWAAPIGLQLAEDVLAPSRSWEYLRIPGDRLRERDGYYSLQVTEELWEAGYFDLVDLIAVDHPADVEIYSNEKVGPAEIANFKLHTVRQRRYPVAARDQRGRDVLSQIRQRDGQFLRAFDKTIVPGLAEEHFLELDLGDLASPKQITLFLTGWIYPTDTSLNVALSRHPQVGGPRPPSVHVPDADGNWQEVQAYMGFPGGKTKTITVDLSNAFLTNDYRVRIATSAEIYWDEAFFTADEEPAECRLTSLTLESADLHYRGFSRALPQRPNAPETYDYESVQTASKWPPMRGAFTRYGDVLELVAEADDRMVILSAGDEMTLHFRAPKAALPTGWVRDFIMHNVGWDKDADLNTVYGQSVEPLPYREMTSYPYGPEAPFPATPSHRDYLQRYQTRFQEAQRFWRRIKDYSADGAGHEVLP